MAPEQGGAARGHLWERLKHGADPFMVDNPPNSFKDSDGAQRPYASRAHGRFETGMSVNSTRCHRRFLMRQAVLQGCRRATANTCSPSAWSTRDRHGRELHAVSPAGPHTTPDRSGLLCSASTQLDQRGPSPPRACSPSLCFPSPDRRGAGRVLRDTQRTLSPTSHLGLVSSQPTPQAALPAVSAPEASMHSPVSHLAL